jgi:hypothetical protein
MDVPLVLASPIPSVPTTAPAEVRSEQSVDQAQALVALQTRVDTELTGIRAQVSELVGIKASIQRTSNMDAWTVLYGVGVPAVNLLFAWLLARAYGYERGRQRRLAREAKP